MAKKKKDKILEGSKDKLISDNEVRWASKKKYPCKKLKGDHDFELAETYLPSRHYVSREVEPIFSRAVYFYRCSACGKKYMRSKPLGVNKKTEDYKEY